MARKSKTFFANNFEVKKQLQVIKQLEKAKLKLEKELTSLFDEYNARGKQSVAEAQAMFDRLPLETLREYTEFAAGVRKETSTDQICIRSKIKRDHNKKLDELEKLISKIATAKHDLLLAKVECLTKKLDKSAVK